MARLDICNEGIRFLLTQQNIYPYKEIKQFLIFGIHAKSLNLLLENPYRTDINLNYALSIMDMKLRGVCGGSWLQYTSSKENLISLESRIRGLDCSVVSYVSKESLLEIYKHNKFIYLHSN